MKSSLSFLILLLIPIMSTHANNTRSHKLAQTCLQIIQEQPQSIEAWIDNKVYLNPSKIRLTKKGIFLQEETSTIELPAFGYTPSVSKALKFQSRFSEFELVETASKQLNLTS
jgi:hypothetical protein